MCLTITGFKTRQEVRDFCKNPSIAKQDIKVYKILSAGGYSPFRIKGAILWERGHHYFQWGNRPFGFDIYNYGEWKLDIDRGLHSCATLKKARGYRDSLTQEIVRMVIPKGAKYFLNKGLYVSDQLIYP